MKTLANVAVEGLDRAARARRRQRDHFANTVRSYAERMLAAGLLPGGDVASICGLVERSVEFANDADAHG